MNKLWSERISFIKKMKEFYSEINYKGINLWPIMAGEIYKYTIPQKESFKYILSLIMKFLFFEEKYKINEKGKILVTYFMNRKDHHDLMFKSIEKFPENEICFMDYYDYKRKISNLSFSLPNITQLFFIWKIFRKKNIKKILGKYYLYFIARTHSRIKEIEKIHKFVEKYKPSGYISFCSSAFGDEAIITLICKKQGIPTFTLQHGFLSTYSNNFASHIIQSENIISDFLLLWGKKSYNIQKKYVDKSKLLVVGCPKYKNKIKHIQKKFNPKEATFFFSVTGYEKSNIYLLNILNRFSLKHPEIKINLKIHPFDNIKNYKRYISSNNLHFVDKEMSVDELLRKSDFIIVHSTSVAYEALLYRIPIFRFNDKHFADLWEIDDIFSNLNDIENLFLKLKNKGIYKKFMSLYNKELKNTFYFHPKKEVSQVYYEEIMKKMKNGRENIGEVPWNMYELKKRIT